VGVGSDGEAEGAGQTEIGELEEVVGAVDEQVLGLEVAVEDAVWGGGGEGWGLGWDGRAGEGDEEFGGAGERKEAASVVSGGRPFGTLARIGQTQPPALPLPHNPTSLVHPHSTHRLEWQ
jgi:hypothetical protein